MPRFSGEPEWMVNRGEGILPEAIKGNLHEHYNMAADDWIGAFRLTGR